MAAETVSIRRAEDSDRPTIAALHIESWRTHYRSALPDDFIDGPLGPTLDETWRTADLSTGAVMIAEDGPTPLGFVAVWREQGGQAFVDNLHVSPARQSTGLGRRLLGAACTRLAAKGACSASLWVFESNPRAIAFYRRLGAETAARGVKDIFGHPVPSLRLRWTDIHTLIEAAG